MECLGSGAPLDPGVEIGWQTLFVANLAEASSRAGGRRFELRAPDGSPIATVEEAADFARHIERSRASDAEA